MKPSNTIRSIAIALAATATMALLCQCAPGASERPADVKLTLAAAASLETVLTDRIIPAFQATHAGISVEGTYDSSGKLQTQIESGLDADVFLSAAHKQMAALTESGYVEADAVFPWIENKLVLVAKADYAGDVAAFEDAARADIVAVGDPESVPAGQYAREAFTSLGIWDAVQAKATLGTNVTEVLHWVADGSATVGVVYATDAAQMPDRVQVLAEAPEGSLAAKIVYPGTVLAASKNAEAAEAFVAYLRTPEVGAMLAEAGFAPLAVE